MLILSEAEVRALLPLEQVIPLMEDALRAFSTGAVLQPVRQALRIAPYDGYLGLMPAHLRAPGGEALGAKAVTFYTGNAGRGLPTHMAVILLWEPTTGTPLAMMDGRLITELRTAAVSAAATKALAAPEAGVLALLGAGVQARSHLAALRIVRPLRAVRVWSRTPERRRTFAGEMSDRDLSITVCETPEAAVRGADLIVTATSSPGPVLRGRWVTPGAHINAVGAPRPDWRELDGEAVAMARVFVDSRAAAIVESGDVIQALQEGAIEEDHIRGEIGDVFAGRLPGRTGPEEVTLFKSLGMAVEDVAAAAYVHALARERGAGREIDLEHG